MKDKLFSIIFSFILIISVLIYSLNIQIIQGAQLKLDSLSRFKTEYISAQRGLIFDRNGIVLAQNKSIYSLYIKPQEIKNTDDLKKVLDSINFSDIDYAINLYNQKKQFDKILLQKSFDNSIAITQYLSSPTKYVGIEIDEEYERIYPQKDMTAHVIGYTGEVTDDDIKTGYRVNTEIGKAGIEMSYDSFLRGIDSKISSDTKTNKQTIENNPINGKNLYLSLDLNIQQKLTQILQDGIKKYNSNAAIGILQKIDTGEILAYVSLPSFDDNLFVGGIGEKDYEKLNNDPNTPQLDRISNATYAPGSVFKLNTSTALLESKSIDINTTFYTGGTFKYGGVTFRDFSNINQGILNVVGGLCRSSNIFMMKSALAMDDHTNGKAIDNILNFGKQYGLGQKTGIDLPEGDPGYISSPKVKKDLTSENWLEGDLLNTAIGQGYTLVSPIQIQTMTTAIATNGSVVQPKLLKSMSDATGDNISQNNTAIVRNKVQASQDTFNTIKQGMYCGVHNGIIQNLDSKLVDISAKSGTAEFGAPDPITGAYPNRHGWITGFMPTPKPKYSFTLMLENTQTSNYTADLARQFIDWLYGTYNIEQKD